MTNRRTSPLFRPIWPTALAAAISAALGPVSLAQPPNMPAPVTLRADTGRPVADALDQVQRLFVSPIAYEELPFLFPGDVQGPAVRHFPSNPEAFWFTLGPSDSNPYLAAQTVLYNYTNVGLPGVYQAVQKNGWVNVAPVRVASADGSIRDVTPVMSQRVTFPKAVRDARATIELIASQISQESGVRVKVLNLPFMNGATLEMGASNEPASDAIATDLAALMGRQVSFRCLWEPTEKDYYLNVAIVAPPNPYKGPPPPRILHPTLQPGPNTNNPWFNKVPK